MNLTRQIPTRPAPAGPPPDDTSWRELPAHQQPEWPNPTALKQAVADLAAAPALISAAECDLLRERLADVARGEAFLLQGGNCAETFADTGPDRIAAQVRTLADMSLALTRGFQVPVVTVGRIAGQYAKPRSESTETRHGETLPTYRGDAVNGMDFTAASRTPDPARLGRVYDASAAALDVLRFGTYDRAGDPGEFFTSHEALILDYEHALTRIDPETGERYAHSGHLLWIGERTRQLDSAHVEFAARVRNPIGIKLGPTVTADEVLALIDRLDPRREPGRLTFITRMGADRVRQVLPGLVEKVDADGARPVWVCDPMHGNTFKAPSGHKTRRFEDILAEIEGFFEVHREIGTHPGGVHLELTPDLVTECVGGATVPGLVDIPVRYESACDPRLNGHQAVELAFAIADLAG